MDATTADLKAVERLIAGLSPENREKLTKIPAVAGEMQKPWRPLPGPQTKAYESEADLLLYGGAAGPGKSELLLGIGVTTAEKSAIFRSQSKDLRALEDRLIELKGDTYYNRSEQVYRDKERLIEFGHLEKPGSEKGWQGRPHDFIGIDEGAQIDEAKVLFVLGWLRSSTGRRCRGVIATNPPLGGEGEWLITWFAPWIDPAFPDPALPGELRWCITDADGRLRWVDGPGEYDIGEDHPVTALSRTFIPGRLDDNPYLSDTSYRAQIQSLPPEMREALLHGNFMAARKDHEWQVVPTAWIRAAQARWKEDGWRGLQMTAIGVDVAQGGTDASVLAPRYGTWFAPLVTKPGVETPDTPTMVGFIVAHQRDNAGLVIDIGGGYGVGPANFMKDNGSAVTSFDGSKPSMKTAQGSTLGFYNKRAEAWWRFREALDPGQEGGSPMALPPDPGMVADLVAPRYEVGPRGIKVEMKTDIKKRLGRSPDKGDAVVYAWSEGQALAEKKLRGAGRRPTVNVGYASMKQRRMRYGQLVR
jgi:hypothetical protein